jgi:pre-mRNA-processing factor 40
VENTSSSIVGMQNGGSSTAVVPVAASTEVPLVATDAGSSRFSHALTIFYLVVYAT